MGPVCVLSALQDLMRLELEQRLAVACAMPGSFRREQACSTKALVLRAWKEHMLLK